jgi:hypothetical protein
MRLFVILSNRPKKLICTPFKVNEKFLSHAGIGLKQVYMKSFTIHTVSVSYEIHGIKA